MCDTYIIAAVYIADTGNNRIRKVTATNIITTIAGTGSTGLPTAVAATDGSAATSALLFCPQGVALDSSGNNKNISKLYSFYLLTIKSR